MMRTAPEQGGNNVALSRGHTFCYDPTLTPLTPPLAEVNGQKTISSRSVQPSELQGSFRGAPDFASKTVCSGCTTTDICCLSHRFIDHFKDNKKNIPSSRCDLTFKLLPHQTCLKERERERKKQIQKRT